MAKKQVKKWPFRVSLILLFIFVASSIAWTMSGSEEPSEDENNRKTELLLLIDEAKEKVSRAELEVEFTGTPEEVEQMGLEKGHDLDYIWNSPRYAWAVYYSIELSLAKWELTNLEWELRLLNRGVG